MTKTLTLRDHARLVALLAEVERNLSEVGEMLFPTGASRPEVRALLRTEKALARIKSPLEAAMFRDHPDEARRIGFAYYGNHPDLGDAARRLAWIAAGTSGAQ